ncbi:MAG: Mth938-like domain-containing protein [Betaproteobacteria bacterium]|nr:Mth938-like domain-containing protein [Betaproteobacteria bacterium]
MKLHLNATAGVNAITGHGPGFVQINQNRVETPLIVMSDQLISPWQVIDPANPALADFAALLELKPELVVFGSGARFRFPDARIMAAFSQARIGFEAMDTPAACRTYNVLMSEGRSVVAALLV